MLSHSIAFCNKHSSTLKPELSSRRALPSLRLRPAADDEEEEQDDSLTFSIAVTWLAVIGRVSYLIYVSMRHYV